MHKRPATNVTAPATISAVVGVIIKMMFSATHPVAKVKNPLIKGRTWTIPSFIVPYNRYRYCHSSAAYKNQICQCESQEKSFVDGHPDGTAIIML